MRPYVVRLSTLTNFFFRLTLKPFSVWKVTMGAIAELQVDAFSTNTGNVFQSHQYVRATGTIQVNVAHLLASYIAIAIRSRTPATDLTSIWTKVTLTPRQFPE